MAASDSPIVRTEGTITIDLGLDDDGDHIVGVNVEGPEDDLPARILVEGALAMARDTLDPIYAEAD